MKKDRFKVIPFVALLLRDGSKILLIKRKNTGFHDTAYACPGGGVDGNETITDAAIREAYEELGIKIRRENIRVAHVLHVSGSQGLGDDELIGFFLEASHWEGDLRNMEPDKCEDVYWFDLDKLPNNLLLFCKQAIEMANKNVFYSEFGW